VTPADRHAPRCVLVTGGCGFIGTNLVRHLLATDPSLRIVNLDALTYAGSRTNLSDVERSAGARYRFVHGDIADAEAVTRLFREEPIDTVIHLAAESHVDRSIDGPDTFLRTNVWGTFVLLQAARAAWRDRDGVRFHHVSTDEVFGSLGPDGFFDETTPYDPSSPYSASKAGSDHLVVAWHRTYGLPVTLSNCSNNYGPYQFPEKLIPLVIAKALAGEPLPVYGDGRHVRDWLYVEDHCRAIDRVVRGAPTGSTYVVGGRNEMPNLELVRLLCDLLGELRPRADGRSYREQITFVPDRPGHDRRYAIDATRIAADLGWMPRETVASGMRRTVAWYLENEAWSDSIRRERYAGERLGTGGGSALASGTGPRR
jgi:dTDP-glucose 4,6-dehydratase